MDYEFSIQILEKEIAHQREMQKLLRGHVDLHDNAFGVVGTRMDRIETVLEKLLTAQVVTESKLQTLISVLAKQHGNGSSN